MRVLVACEESQTVCKAFRRLGVEAYSSDIQDYGYRDRVIEGIPSYVGTHYGSKSRSKFFEGIANAMAVQWSNL